MKSKVGILLVSKNNYSMIPVWYDLYDYSNCKILNLDEVSKPAQRIIGKQYCDERGIEYLDIKRSGIQNNLIQAIEYFKNKDIDWILYSHHDSYPLTENFFEKLNNYIADGKLDQFGVIGFNVLNGKHDLIHWNGDNTPCRSTARCPLEKGDILYRVKQEIKFKNMLLEIKKFLKGVRVTPRIRYNNKDKRPFAVESVFYTSAMINSKQYKKFIKVDGNYQMFLAWDDIAFQFLSQNVYNIVLPQFHYAHDQELKIKHGLPRKSPITNEKHREYLYGKWGHLDTWRNKWGFRWDLYYTKSDFEKVKDTYKGTLLEEFYNYDPINGPLRYFDL